MTTSALISDESNIFVIRIRQPKDGKYLVISFESFTSGAEHWDVLYLDSKHTAKPTKRRDAADHQAMQLGQAKAAE